MNTRLLAILDWAESASIDLSNAQITLGSVRYDYVAKSEKLANVVQLFHDKERRQNIVNLKRAVDLEEHGSPPYVELRAQVTLSNGELLVVKYEGAFECKVSHTCKPKGWSESQIEAETPVEIGEETDPFPVPIGIREAEDSDRPTLTRLNYAK